MNLPLSYQLALGFGLAACVAWVGWRRRALSVSGAIGACLVGGFSFGLGGPTWGLILIAFFLSSTLLSFYRMEAKAPAAGQFAKSSRRDLAQVLANGGLSTLLAVIAGIVRPYSPWYPTLLLVYVGALGAAAADTWATELGVLSTRPPRLITTGQPVPAGRSGGVTLLGLAGSLAGAAFIGVTAFLLFGLAQALGNPGNLATGPMLIPITTLAGFFGSIIDSVLGATWQRLYLCPFCHILTERRTHSCGAITQAAAGLPWLNNDVVNFFATAAGAAAAFGLSIFLLS